MDYKKLGQLKGLLEHVPKPPFNWSQCYEMPNGDIHWALVDPASESDGKVSCCYMILEASYDKTMAGGTIATEPLPQLVVESLNVLPELLEKYQQLEELKAYCRTVRKGLDRAVRGEDGVVGYWQCTEWIDGLLELCKENDR